MDKETINAQIKECKKIISSINSKNYYDAGIRILYNLNNNNYIWYKPVNSIIKDQITNLLFDIETNFKDDLTRTFFKRTIKKLEFYSNF